MSTRHDPSRRSVLIATSAAAALAAARGIAGPAPAAPNAARPDAVASNAAAPSAASPTTGGLSAHEAVRLMSSGELRCEAYATTLLERCRAAHELNAFITLEPETVLEDARRRDRERAAGSPLGPLFGLPIPVKDSVNTSAYPTTAGTPALRGFRPAQDAPVVAALKKAGAIVLGKTNLHELSFGWTSNNPAFGAVRNPYDRTRIPGGSSGGTAAAIAAGLAPLGVAEDTEGSIRVPAALCGIAGLRPTTGRYPTTGCVPISPLFDQVGPHARSVADLALFDAALTGSAALAPAPLEGVRLGIIRDFFFEGLDPEVERITERALEAMRSAGIELIETPLPGIERLVDLTTDPVQNHDVRIALARYLKTYHAGLDLDTLIERASPNIRAIFKSDVFPGGANFVTEAAYAAARDRYLPALRALYRSYFERTRVAAIVFPATRITAARIGEETSVLVRGETVPFEAAIARNIAPGSTAGLPGLVLPAGLSAGGLPVGIELDGPKGSDRQLLALGASLERILPPMPAPPASFTPAAHAPVVGRVERSA